MPYFDWHGMRKDEAKQRDYLQAALTPATLDAPLTVGESSRRCEVAPSVDELSELTVPLLKQRLRDAGLPVAGRKAELIERLVNGAP